MVFAWRSLEPTSFQQKQNLKFEQKKKKTLILFQRFTSPLFCCVFDDLEELCQLVFILFL